MKNKKAAIAMSLTLTSAILLGLGAKALFVDESNVSQALGRMGTLDITVSDMSFDTSEVKEEISYDDDGNKVVTEVEKDKNVNPGDNDPYGPGNIEGYRPGTDHEISYTVTSTGTKSVRLKHVITLELLDENNNRIDPTSLMISKLEDNILEEYMDNGDMTCRKYYVYENGNRAEVTKDTVYGVWGDSEDRSNWDEPYKISCEPSKENIYKINNYADAGTKYYDIVSVVYVITNGVLDGVSNGEVNNDGTPVEELEHKEHTTSLDFSFHLGMYHDVNSTSFEKASVVAEDGKIYLRGYYSKTVECIPNGVYKAASETDSKGNMYYSKDYLEDETLTKVTYVDMKYHNASLTAADGKKYLVKGLSFDEDGNPKGTEATASTDESLIAHWDVSNRIVKNENPQYYIITSKDEYKQINEMDVIHFDEDDNMVFPGEDTYYYMSGEEKVFVEKSELKHWDVYFNEVLPETYDLVDGYSSSNNSKHENVGCENGTIVITLDTFAMQYRNASDESFGDWVEYNSQTHRYE